MKNLLVTILLATSTAFITYACGDGCKGAGQSCEEDRDCCSDDCDGSPNVCQGG